jgi:hypothetical protein
MASKVLKFKYKPTANMAAGIREAMQKFLPGGHYALNSTEWRGKEPRSCAVTGISSPPHSAGEQVVFDLEVTYKPKGHISYTGKTRYDGWTAMMPEGGPIADGQQPNYTAKEVFGEQDYNGLDFGEFVGEYDMDDIKRTTIEQLHAEMLASGKFSAGVSASFMAAHRHRPQVKIILTNKPDFEAVDGFGTRVVNVNIQTPNLEQVLMQRITALMHDFMQGKVSINNSSCESFTFVKLSDVLVDCELNEIGEDSSFNILHHNTPLTFLDELARQITAVYEVKAEIVTGKDGGIVLRRDTKKK